MIKKTRYEWPDAYRGFAVALMIFYHLSYDLNHFRIVKIDLTNNPFWFGLPRLIVFLFFSCAGLSLGLANKKGLKRGPYARRLGKLSIGALAITISTYFLYPNYWIYFGTLHSLAFCSVIAIPFLRRRKWAFGVALLLFTLEFAGVEVPWVRLGHESLDYISPFPWFGAMALGLWCVDLNFYKGRLPGIFKEFAFLGRHAFWIYILHQPLLYGLTLGLTKLM